MKIYLAGSISGKSYTDVMAYYNMAIADLTNFGYDVLSPMYCKGYLKNEQTLQASGYTISPISNNHAIYTRDKWFVEQSDIVLANLLSEDRVSIGTMFELAWASMLNKHIIVIVHDDTVLYNHAFIKESANIIFHKYEHAKDYLQKLISKEM